MKLLLGYSISLPIDNNPNIPDYSVEDIKLIKNLSKKFNCIQIMFSKNILSKENINCIKNILLPYKNIFVHASYQINMGSDLLPSQTDLYNVGIDILINQINYGNKIGMKGIVLHLGKNVKKKYDIDFIYNNMVKFIIELFNKLKSKKINANILLETSSGQGGEMLFELDQLVEFIQKFKNLEFYNKIGLCIDTCHIFQAGYDLNNSKIIKKIHDILEPIKDKIKLIHLNDSYNKVGQHIDRHEQIGKGYINIDKLIKFILPYKNIPMILETKPPYDKQIDSLYVE
jgi:deoxyribonuclease-4